MMVMVMVAGAYKWRFVVGLAAGKHTLTPVINKLSTVSMPVHRLLSMITFLSFRGIVLQLRATCEQ